MTTVQAAGGAVYRLRDGACEVLLIFKRDVWDLPKGKKEEKESFENCAQREVAEETGVTSAIEKNLVNTRHQYSRNKQHFNKITRWFVMRGDKETVLKPQKKEGITKAEWTPLDEAVEKVGYDNLAEVLEKLSAYLRGV